MPTIQVKVKPGSKVSELLALDDGTYAARVKGQPVDGKANAELVALIAKHFGCGKSAVSIRAGAGSRVKLVQVAIK